jgi:hypothetical protein
MIASGRGSVKGFLDYFFYWFFGYGPMAGAYVSYRREFGTNFDNFCDGLYKRRCHPRLPPNPVGVRSGPTEKSFVFNGLPDVTLHWDDNSYYVKCVLRY